MVRKLLSATLVVFFALAGSAVIPRLNKAEVEERAKAIVKNELPAGTQMQSQEIASHGVEYPGSGSDNPVSSVLQAGNEFVPVEVVDARPSAEIILSEDSVIGVASEGDKGIVSVAPKKIRKAEGAAAPKLVTGTMMTKDLNYNSVMYSSRITIESTETEGEYELTNVYCLNGTINMKINLQTGEVLIPQQKIYNLNPYGEVSMVPLLIKDGKFLTVEGDLKGTLLGDGTIELGTWGVMVTQMEEVDGVLQKSKNWGRLFNVFPSSEWKVPNTEVSCYNISQNKLMMYEMYIEQTQPNEAVFYGFGNINSNDVLTSRLTVDKRILISPQLMYNNALYGEFLNYPANFELDVNTQKWKTSVDSKGNMVIKDDGNGELSIGGWVISARSNPTQTIGYAYNDVSIQTTVKMEYPAPLALDMKGEGTATSPYVIESFDNIKAIAQASETGTSFEGVHFALGSDLDLSGMSPTAYSPIGSVSTPFNGKLNGQGHKISNFIADGKGFCDTGFFGVIGENGSVNNIVFENPRLTSTGNYIGVVAGTSSGEVSDIIVQKGVVDCNGAIGGGIVGNVTGGIVKNSSFNGNVTSTGSVGGIAGHVLKGGISSCEVRANITIDGMKSSSYRMAGGIAGQVLYGNVAECYVSGVVSDAVGYAYVGGVVAYLSESSLVDSFNTAAISAKRVSFGSIGSGSDDDTQTGGIVGNIRASEMSNCYNSGTILKTDKSECVGGIVGYIGVSYVFTSGKPLPEMTNVSHIRNCYNSGQIISTSSSTLKGVVGNWFVSQSYTGPSPIEVCIENCYFDSQIAGFDHESWGLSTRELTSRLPNGFDTEKWTKESGKYPVLYTGKGSQARELSSLPLILRDVDDSSKVKVEFSFASSPNVTWELDFDEETGETAAETKALKITGNKVVVKDQYSNSIINAVTADNWGIKLYRLAVVPKVFDGEGTVDDPYLVKTPEDFNKLHEAVSTYKQSHKGDYFEMANDVDFSSAEDFNGVGYGATGANATINQFCGIFNGAGHTVSGLKIDGVVRDDKNAVSNLLSNCYTGLFSYIGQTGVVRNLNIADDCEFMHYSYGGSVAGVNQGLVENCRNYTAVNAMTSYVGGIVGYNHTGGKVNKCYNGGAVNFGTANGGGIVGYNAATACVSKCQNDGDVFNKSFDKVTEKTKTNCVGGVVGTNYGKIECSVNNGGVQGFDKVGGIAGAASNYNGEGDIAQCINSGVVNVLESTLSRGGVLGSASGSITLTGNYYDASVNVNGGANNNGVEGATGLSSSELVAGNALAGLPAEEFDFTPNAYPVLKAFANENASRAMRSIYVAFAPEQMRTNVLTEVPLSKAEGVEFKLEKNESFKIEGDRLTVIKPEGMTLVSDRITATCGNYAKSFDLNAVPVILKGEGTKESPYLIETPADWNKLADFMESSQWEYSGNFFRIENDIDFQGDSIKLLAVNGVNFQAELDGAKHTIKNYLYSNNNSIKTKLQGPNLYVGKYLGLIGTLGATGVVKDLIIDGELKGHSLLGSIVGNNYGVIDNVTNKGVVESLTDAYVAGIANRAYENSVIRNCVNEGTVISKKTYATGIVYETKAGSLIENCINKGSVTATTSYAMGITVNASGGIKGCENEGVLMATGSVAGLVYKVDATGYMEDCVNKADIDLSKLAKPGGNIYGIACTTTALKAIDPDGLTGYIRNCHNTGNLKGGANVGGGVYTISAGWKIQDCSNTGNIESTGLAVGFGSAAGGGANLELLSEIDRCFNAGEVRGNAGKVSGFLGETKKFSIVRDSYNMGNVYSSSSNLCASGFISQVNGVIERCFNAGDVTVDNNAAGGLFGYLAGGDVSYPAAMRNSFNIGNITSNYAGTATQGNAGGLGGYLSTSYVDAPHMVENCYNTGNVTAKRRVGGLFGGAFTSFSFVRNCYNSGKVTCLETNVISDNSERYLWSGTTYTNNYTYKVDGVEHLMLENHENCFYDVELNPGSEFRTVPGSKKTTKEMKELMISDGFVNPSWGGYPVLACFADNDAANAGSAMLLLAENDTYGKVSGEITLVGPEGCEWLATDLVDDEGADVEPASEETAVSKSLKIDGGRAVPTASGKVKLTCLYKGFKKDFTVVVDYKEQSSVEESFAGKEVKEVVLIDLQGRAVVTPEPGQVYIMRTVFTDGTMKVEKKIAKN